MKPVVLITRPNPVSKSGGTDFVQLAEAQGYRAVSDPLLAITPLPQVFETMPAVLVTTSAQAFRIEYPKNWMQLPLFVMGATSAEQASAAGFETVHSSGGDFSALLDLIRRNVPTARKIMYLRGETIRHDLRGSLPDHQIEEVIVYKAEAAPHFSAETLRMLKAGEISVITLFSPRSAEIFHDLVMQAGLAAVCQGIKLLCLSPAVLESVKALPWQDIRISASASQHDMASALQDWMRPDTNE